MNLRLPARRAVGQTPADVIYTEAQWRLLRYRSTEPAQHHTPLLLVPSLINRHYVLDLLPDKSFAAWMVAQGHDVYIIDWGRPRPEDRYLSFDDVCDRYLGHALRRTREAGLNGRWPHVLGYCLGGTLAAIHLSAHPERASGFVALATPVAFNDDGLLTFWSRVRALDLEALHAGLGNMPWPLMQAGFNLLRPTLPLVKLVGLAEKLVDPEGAEAVEGILALETWGSDNVSFAGRCFKEYIQGLYRDDALMKGTFALSGRPARLERLTAPLMAITFENDTIVPKCSSVPLLAAAGSADKTHVHLPGGHVGAVVSRKAATSLWPRISSWLGARDA